MSLYRQLSQLPNDIDYSLGAKVEPAKPAPPVDKARLQREGFDKAIALLHALKSAIHQLAMAFDGGIAGSFDFLKAVNQIEDDIKAAFLANRDKTPWARAGVACPPDWVENLVEENMTVVFQQGCSQGKTTSSDAFKQFAIQKVIAATGLPEAELSKPVPPKREEPTVTRGMLVEVAVKVRHLKGIKHTRDLIRDIGQSKKLFEVAPEHYEALHAAFLRELAAG